MDRLVSVVVVTYNQRALIARCLDAILAQQCSWPYEVIVGDDGSTDGTTDICRRYARRYPDRVRLVAHESNQGLLRNYYHCVRLARGTYLTDCGGDDEWMPGRLQLLLDTAEAHPDVALVLTTKTSRHEGTGRLTTVASPWPEGVVDGDEMTYRVMCATAAAPGNIAMMRMSAVHEAMRRWPQFFGERCYMLEDLQIVACLGRLGKVYNLPRPTYYYTLGVDNVSTGGGSRKRFRFETSLLRLTLDLITDLPLSRQRLLPLLQYRVLVLLMHAFRLRDAALRQQALAMAKAERIPLITPRLRLVRAATACQPLWIAALAMRRVVVAAKHILSRMG